MTASLDESSDRHTWTFSNQPVTQVCLDRSSCRLESWSLHASLEIRLRTPFRLALPDGMSREIDPEAPETVAPILTLVDRQLLRMAVTRSASLEIDFSDGSMLTATAHHRNEAFEINGGGALEGMRYVARPGGGVPWSVP
jgi:hypothetical protein